MGRPGPVWYSPPRTGLVSRMRDGFDHRRERKPRDERASLLGSDFEVEDVRGGKKEEDILQESQDRSCLKGSIVIEMYDSEPVDRRERVNRPSLSSDASNSARESALDGNDDVQMSEWRCDCGRIFQKRHELK